MNGPPHAPAGPSGYAAGPPPHAAGPRAPTGPPRLTRRALLGGALAGAGAAALAGCGSAVGAGLANTQLEPGTVEYWNLFGGGDGVRMQQMQQGFTKTHPGTGLRAITLTWGNPYYTKLALATVGGKPPDVAVSHLTRMKTLIGADLLQELRPDDLARHGMSAADFNQRAWQAGLIGGKAYGIPLDTHPVVLFYNTEVCKKAGLLDADGKLAPIRGEQAFLDALRKAKQVTGGYGATHGINNDSASPWRVFQTLYSQLGGTVLGDEGTSVTLDDAKATQVLTFLRSLTVGNGLLPSGVEYQGAVALFATGQAGFHINGEWEITTFQTAKTPFSMTLFPQVYGDTYAVAADSHVLVLPKRPGGDLSRLDMGLTFVKSMLDQSLTWAMGGHIPAWLPTASSADYQALSPQSSYAAAADGAVYDPPAWYSGSGSNFENVVGSSVGAAEAGQLSPAAAVAQIRSKLGTLARTPPPV
jgi:multiple sugar transport system substrate-binding protein